MVTIGPSRSLSSRKSTVKNFRQGFSWNRVILHREKCPLASGWNRCPPAEWGVVVVGTKSDRRPVDARRGHSPSAPACVAQRGGPLEKRRQPSRPSRKRSVASALANESSPRIDRKITSLSTAPHPALSRKGRGVRGRSYFRSTLTVAFGQTAPSRRRHGCSAAIGGVQVCPFL